MALNSVSRKVSLSDSCPVPSVIHSAAAGEQHFLVSAGRATGWWCPSRPLSPKHTDTPPDMTLKWCHSREAHFLTHWFMVYPITL